MKNKFLIIVLICTIVFGLMTLSGCFLFNNSEDELFEFGSMKDDTYYIKSVKSKDVTTIDIPSTYKGKTVKEIGRSAFQGCNKLVSITIPEGVEEIDVGAFDDCSKLETVSIPNSIKSIKYAFSGCTSLKYNVYENGKYLGNSDNKYLVLMDGIDREATTFTANESCKVIYYQALAAFTKLTTLDLPYSITYIGSAAFAICSSLKSFVVPNYITEFDASWFDFCSSLKTITLGANIKTVSIDHMSRCTSFEEFVVNSSNTTFAAKDGVLYSNDLKTLLAYPVAKKGSNFSIPSYVENVATYAFDGCIYLESLTMWSTVKSMHHSAVINCNLLHTLHYRGTMSEWIAFDNANNGWDHSFVVNKVICTDGTLARSKA